MNDRFKFRFWDKHRKEIITFNGFPEAIGYILTNKIMAEPYIIMQSTGLKDKNGKLIFEGDVIKYYFDDDSEDFIVKYSEKNLAFITETLDGKYQNNFIGYDIIPTKEYEIIGNIFENKELLNGTNP